MDVRTRSFAAGLLVLLSVPAGTARAQDWFTIQGYPEQPDGDRVEISPTATRWNDQYTVEVRVSRSTERAAYGGGTYRSHQSLAVIDCQTQQGWYARMSFYQRPNWQGPVTATRSFGANSAPLVFNDIPGDPAGRLVKAACALGR